MKNPSKNNPVQSERNSGAYSVFGSCLFLGSTDNSIFPSLV